MRSPETAVHASSGPGRLVLRPGSRGPAVAALQRRLAELGWYGGEPDGVYGELTEDAVRALQRAFRLRADGVAGPDVRRLLEDPLLAQATAPGRHLAVAWGHAPGEPEGLPAWLSARAAPWMEIAVDLLGRVVSFGPATPGSPPAPARASAPGPGLGVSWIPVVILRPARALAPLRAPEGAAAVQALSRGAPLRRLVFASAAAPAGRERPGGAELPPPGASALARRLAARGIHCWLSLRILDPRRRGNLVWWGYEMARRTAPFERLILWAPGPESPPDAVVAALRAAVRGIRRWRPPWQVLVGADLAPWLVEAGQSPGRTARRLTRSEAVLTAWQLRLRRLRGEPPESLPTLLRLGPEGARALVRLVRWAGLGGVVLRGVEDAEGPTVSALGSALEPLPFSAGDGPS